MIEPRGGLGEFAAAAQALRGLVRSCESRHDPRLPVGQREALAVGLQAWRRWRRRGPCASRRHRTNFMNKLGVGSVAELVQLAVEAGLSQPE